MEKAAALIGELNLGKDLAEQLKKQLNSHQPCESLIQKIVSSYDRAISLLNFVASPELRQDSSSGCSRKRVALTHPEILAVSKRKKMQKWSQQVRASEGAGVLDDGFSWRKYGQKDILGANFPRAYYRCSHRNVQGCLATKQVQRSDKDLSVFEITYKGRHTCIQSKVSKTVLKLEGVDETLKTDDLIRDEDLSNEIIETIMANPKKEEVSLVESCSSYPFIFPQNFESDLFPSFKSEFQQVFEGLDYDMGKEVDWSGFDSNFSLEILDFYDVIQSPLRCES